MTIESKQLQSPAALYGFTRNTSDVCKKSYGNSADRMRHAISPEVRTLGNSKLKTRGRSAWRGTKRALPIIAEVGFEDQHEDSLPANFLCQSTGFAPDSWPKALVNSWSLTKDEAYCKAVATRLKYDTCNRSALFAWLCPALLSLALSDCGSSVVHAILSVVSGLDRNMITSQFHGSVNELCVSPTGHLVLSELIGTMPISMIDFVCSELEGKASVLARHMFGYRVLETLIMHGSHVQTSNLSVELARAAAELAKDSYGQSVLRHLWEHGSEKIRWGVMQSLIAETSDSQH
jgi:hypothetical protein